MINFGWNTLHDMGRVVAGRASASEIREAADLTKIRFNNLLNRKQSFNVDGYDVLTGDYDSFEVLYNEIYVKKLYDITLGVDKPVIFDCGSNIGLSVLRFKRLYPDATIEAFEPDREAYNLLTANLENNHIGGVNAHNVAVSDHEGSEEFYYDPVNRNNLSMGLYQNESTKEHYPVQVAPLSKYLRGHVDLLKIDIEGSEISALHNIEKQLYGISNIIVEYHGYVFKPFEDSTYKSLVEMLFNYGFNVRILDFDANQYSMVFHARREPFQPVPRPIGRDNEHLLGELHGL